MGYHVTFPNSSHRCECCADLVPVRAIGLRFGRAEPREPRGIEHDHAFVGNLQFDDAFGRDWLRQGHDGFRQRSGVIDV